MYGRLTQPENEGTLKRGVGRKTSGGAWNNNPENCRSAIRNNNSPGNRNNNVGFRVSCSAPSTLLLLPSPWASGWSELADGNLSGVPSKESRPTPAMPKGFRPGGIQK